MYYGKQGVQSLSDPDQVFDFYDDFSSDPNTNGKWLVFRYSNDPDNEFKYDSQDKSVYLTTATNSKGSVGILEKNGKPLQLPNEFEIRFKYKIGGGTGADGIVFMFFKDVSKYIKYGRCYAGGNMGFDAYDGSSRFQVKGYGVQFDNYYNSNCDPSERHIAIIKDSECNHLKYVNTDVTEDNKIHNVIIRVLSNKIDVYVDGSLMLSYTGNIDRTYRGVGFGAGTGGKNNNQIIYGSIILRKITDKEPEVTINKPNNYIVSIM